jgi:hypothetical protein
MVTVGARKPEGFVRKEKFGRILDMLADFDMYSFQGLPYPWRE